MTFCLLFYINYDKIELRNTYDEHDDNTIVLYFESGHAVISLFTEEPKIIDF